MEGLGAVLFGRLGYLCLRMVVLRKTTNEQGHGGPDIGRRDTRHIEIQTSQFVHYEDLKMRRWENAEDISVHSLVSGHLGHSVIIL